MTWKRPPYLKKKECPRQNQPHKRQKRSNKKRIRRREIREAFNQEPVAE